jgi:hypothetical protein
MVGLNSWLPSSQDLQEQQQYHNPAGLQNLNRVSNSSKIASFPAQPEAVAPFCSWATDILAGCWRRINEAAKLSAPGNFHQEGKKKQTLMDACFKGLT